MLTVGSKTHYYQNKISNLGTQRSRRGVNITTGRGIETKNRLYDTFNCIISLSFSVIIAPRLIMIRLPKIQLH